MSKSILIFVIAFGLIAVSSCDNNSTNDSTPPTILSSPKITMAPNPDTPLVGILDLSTDEPTRVRVSLSNESVSRVIDFDEFNTDHSLPILGFHPGKSHMIHVIVLDEAGNETSADSNILVITDPLPEGFPPIEVLISKPDKMEPGVTLFTWQVRSDDAVFRNVLAIVDETGEVVWYHNPGRTTITDARRISNGNLLFMSGGSIVEMDMLGNVVQKWQSLGAEEDDDSIPVATLSFHHEVFPMESGNFLVLSKEEQLIDNYPTSETDPLAPTETALVTGDLVVEFSRDGSIVNEWSLLDMLDPLRIGYDSLIFFQGDRGQDWSHCNGVIHDPGDDSIIVSCRHQDAVIKFSRSTGELIWILGPHENWDPDEFGKFLLTPTNESEFFWAYHMHAPMITPGGCHLLFDNGNYRASPPDETLPAEENFSRAVEYCIDETSNEITLIWEYGQFAEEIIFTAFVGDADFLPRKGNVLITFGGVPIANSVRIIEVTQTTPAEKVFDLKISGGGITYRSERLSSLYPPKNLGQN